MKRQVTPQLFRDIFENTPGGADLLEHLVARFGQSVYVKGGHEADRETCHRAGQRAVIDYMIAMINRANGITDE